MARPTDLEEAERIVARRERAPLETLFRFIHAVNPTGRGLRGSVEHRHYKAKSGLQSLLIEQHGDALSVRPDPLDLRIVSLLHKLLPRDAGHALVDELSDAARAWVRTRLLQTDDDESSVVEPEIDGPEPEGVLARARAAHSQHDHYAAEPLYREAFAESPGLETTIALLDVLIEGVWRPDEALALRIPESLRRSGRVRVRLAEACLNLDPPDPATALEHAVGLLGVRAGVALRTAASLLLDRLDVERAARGVAGARDADPSNGAQLDLEARLGQERDRRRRPLADAVRDAIRRRAWPEARQHLAALAMGGATPDVKTLRDQIDRGENADQSEALVAAAEATTSLVERVNLLTRAKRLGREDLDGRIVALEQQLADDRREAAVSRVLALLAEDDPHPGIEAFAELDATARGTVIARSTHPALDEVERFLRTGRSAPQALAALDALHRVRRVATRNDPAALLRAANASGLLDDPEVARLRERAARDIADRDRRANGARLARAEAARSRSDVALCRRLLDTVDVGDPADEARVAALRAWVRSSEQQEAAEAEWQQLAALRFPFDARDYASERVGDDPVWAERVRWADDRLREIFVLTEHDPTGLDRLPRDLWLRMDEAWTWAAGPDGPIAVVETAALLVLVRELDPATGRLVRAWSVRTPMPMGSVFAHGWDGGHLWIVSLDRGCALVVDAGTGRIVSWCELRVQTGGKLRTVNVIDGVAWLACGPPDHQGDPAKVETHLFDLRRRGRLTPSDHPGRAPTHVPGDPPCCVAYELRRGADRAPVVVYDGRGRELRRIGAVGGLLRQAIPDPDGDVIVPVSVHKTQGPIAALDPHVVQLWRCREGADPVLASFEDGPLVSRFRIVSALRPQGLLVVHAWNGDEHWLGAYRFDGDVLKTVWRVDPAPEGSLVTTPHGTALWFACRTADRRRAEFHRITDRAPELTHQQDWRATHAPMFRIQQCEMLYPTTRHDGSEIPLGPVDRAPDGIAAVNTIASKGDRPNEEIARELDVARQRFPTDPYIAVYRAQLALKRRDWAEIEDLLGEVDLTRLGGPTRRHALHLLGAAQAYRGQGDDAHETWSEALQFEGDCDVQHELTVLEHLGTDQAPDAASFLGRQLLAACGDSDRRLRRGDAAGAFAALEPAEFWEARDLQTDARRAAAALAWTDGPDGVRRRAMAVALQRIGADDCDRWPDLPVQPHWGSTQLHPLHARLQEALDMKAPFADLPPERLPARRTFVPSVPLPEDDPVGSVRREIGAHAAGGDVRGAREGLARMEESGALPVELAEARRTVDDGERRIRGPLAALLQDAIASRDPDEIRAAADLLVQRLPDDDVGLKAIEEAKRLARLRARAARETARAAETRPPRLPPQEAPALPAPDAVTQGEPAPAAAPMGVVGLDARVDASDPPRERPVGELPEWLQRIEPQTRPEPVDAPSAGDLRVHLERPTTAHPLPMRLELLRTSPFGALPPIPCPASDREAKKVVRGLDPHELAVIRGVAHLARLVRFRVHVDAPAIVGQQVLDLLPALSQVDVRFDGDPVTVDWTPLRPRIRATGDDDGLDLAWSPALLEVWRIWPGLVLDEERVLRPVAEEVPSRVLGMLGRPLPRLERHALDAFIQDLVVDRGIDFDVPDGTAGRRLAFHALAPTDRRRQLLLSEDGDRLVIEWAVAYQTPAEEIQVRSGIGGRYAHGRHGVVVRDVRFEQQTAQRFADAFGMPHAVRLPEELAVQFLVADLPSFRRDDAWQVLGEDRLLKFRTRGMLEPSIGVQRDQDWFELAVDFRLGDLVVSLAEALAIWKGERRFKVLSDGAIAALPARWLLRHGAGLEELQDTLGRNPDPGPYVAGIVAELLQDEGHGAAWGELSSALIDAAPSLPPSGFRGELRPYQQVGLGWMKALRDRGVGGVLADEMGLGKTVQVLALVCDTHRTPGAPSLVVAPTSVAPNWVAEAGKFTPDLRVVPYFGPGRDPGDIAGADLVVTTYGILTRDLAQLGAIEWRHAILDEAQWVKTPSAERAKAARALRARHRLTMTGTPIENSLLDLWSQFEFVMPGFFGTRTAFERRYEGPVRARDPEALRRLNERIRPFKRRRLKQDVATDLPDRIEETLRIALFEEDVRWYTQIRDAVRLAVALDLQDLTSAVARMHVLTELLRLRRVACHPGLLEQAKHVSRSAKCEAAIELLDKLRDGGHRCLVFSEWPSLLQLLRARIREQEGRDEPLYMDGDTVDRKALVDTWNGENGPDVFLLSIRVGGAGLNLIGADTVLLMEPSWNPAVEDQAIARAHRIGQRKEVTVYRLVAAGTVEEKVRELQEAKRWLANEIVDLQHDGRDQLTRENVEAMLAAEPLRGDEPEPNRPRGGGGE